jgi:hypothetical protein
MLSLEKRSFRDDISVSNVLQHTVVKSPMK